MYRIEFTRDAVRDVSAHRRSGARALLRKLEVLPDELATHPRTGTGRPEQLRHGLAGYWSRRLSAQHRSIYRIEEDHVLVVVVAATGHYSDR